MVALIAPAVAADNALTHRGLVVVMLTAYLIMMRHHISHLRRAIPPCRAKFDRSVGQAFGRLAQQLLPSLVFKRVAHVLRVDVNLELVRRGLAWHYTRHSSDPRLAAAERTARTGRLGLWADAHPTPPWDWRHGAPAR